ncbi:MAG: ATP-binding cassette domain-containing protein [Phycisphaerales bacterium]
MPPALRIEDLSFRYDRGAADAQPVVRIDRFELGEGEFALLRGHSGSGKTTLLSLVAGLLEPTLGTVEISGQRVHALRGAARDRFRGEHLGLVFQTFNLLHGFTALENVLAGMMFSRIPRVEHRPRALALLKRLGIDRIDARPEQLSVGQQQRVAVARAVAARPALVLADEPTASLDPLNADGALELIKEACREADAALLCVSHDPTASSHFDRVEDLASLAGGAGVGAS